MLLSLAVIVVVVLLVHRAMPSPRAVLDAVRGASWWLLIASAGLQAGSVWMLSVQQRRLLRAMGTPVGPWQMAAITTASTAVSLTVPAGGAVGAGWSFRQYRLAGASRVAASTVTVVSGLAGAAALAALVALLWTTFRTVHALTPGDHEMLVTVLVLLVQTTVLWTASTLWSRWCRRRLTGRLAPGGPRTRTRAGSRRDRIGHEVRAAVIMTRSLGRGAWRDATAASVLSRLLDAGCLYACCLSLGVSADFVELALVYLGIQLVRQIPLTPGGIGVVEVALLSGLTSIGVAAASGAAVVVIYRLVAAWLWVPLGYGALIALRTRQRRLAATTKPGQRGEPALLAPGSRSPAGEDEP